MAQTLFELPGDGEGSLQRALDAGGRIPPLLKWPGGKGSELATILPALPNDFNRYFEPFVGGGAVYFAIPSERPAFINDASTDLMAFYGHVHQQNEDLFDYLGAIERWWVAIAIFTDTYTANLVNFFRSGQGTTGDYGLRMRELVESVLGELANTVPEPWADLEAGFVAHARDLVPKKLTRMWAVQAQRDVDLPEADVWGNLEGAFKAACYTTLRSAYNVSRSEGRSGARHTALFFFLREYAYAAMFRFNAKGEFNVPYGGMTYNRKDFARKIERLRAPAVVDRLESTTLFCEDFEAFFAVHSPTVNDFVFLDPPYDSDFSDYDRNSFGRRDHARLAARMADLPCRFQLVIKSTPAVLDIYAHPNWHVLAFDKKYMWTIKERNNRDATHLMIMNYAPEPTKAGSWGGPR